MGNVLITDLIASFDIVGNVLITDLIASFDIVGMC